MLEQARVVLSVVTVDASAIQYSWLVKEAQHNMLEALVALLKHDGVTTVRQRDVALLIAHRVKK